MLCIFLNLPANNISREVIPTVIAHCSKSPLVVDFYTTRGDIWSSNQSDCSCQSQDFQYDLMSDEILQRKQEHWLNNSGKEAQTTRIFINNWSK